jgi:hypothetical protein
MNEQQRLSVFQAQTQNVRELKKAWAQVNRQINASLVHQNNKAVEINTKLLALIYCALAEAIFSKLIHTPHGLSLNEIDQIRNVSNQKGVKFGWTKCAELAMQSVEGEKSNHEPNVLKKLSSLIEQFIFDPSLMRNKLAHGQWCIALNHDNTAVNLDITKEVARCTIIDLYRRENALERLAAIIEDMVESPNKAHRRDYWTHLCELEDAALKMSAWTIESKVKQLTVKRSYMARS